MLHRTPFTSFPTDQNDARVRDFDPLGVTLSRTWRRVPSDDEYTSGKTHERKRGGQPAQRLNKRKHGQNEHSDEHHMTSRNSPKSQSITSQLNRRFTAFG